MGTEDNRGENHRLVRRKLEIYGSDFDDTPQYDDLWGGDARPSFYLSVKLRSKVLDVYFLFEVKRIGVYKYVKKRSS